MAELTKNLHFLKNGTEQTAKIYTTASEAGSNYITVKVDGTTGYVPINDISHGNATIGRVAKGGSIYAILSRFAQILSYVGTATPLSVARCWLAATTVGNYALFAGGEDSSKYKNTVDAYDASLTRTIPTPLSENKRASAATTVGDYALFAGGEGNDSYYRNTVDAYDTSLTRTIPSGLSLDKSDLAATTVGNYALFGGGGYYDDGEWSRWFATNTVDAYDTSLTKTIPTLLSQISLRLAATSVGNYALFAGGRNKGISGSRLDFVNAYDTSLTRTIPTPLSEAGYLTATSVGNYALFGDGNSFTVNAYDTSLTRTTATPLSEANNVSAATTLGDYALFGGRSTVDAYDTSLTRTTATPLSEARNGFAATSVGNYALFGGGVIYANSNSTYYNTVDVYTVS